LGDRTHYGTGPNSRILNITILDTFVIATEGRQKAELNNEITTRANAQRDIELVQSLKLTLAGTLKRKVTEQILLADQHDMIRRQFSEDMNQMVDKLTKGSGSCNIMTEIFITFYFHNFFMIFSDHKKIYFFTPKCSIFTHFEKVV